MDDARLCLENVLVADQKGATVANYIDVRSFIKEGGRTVGVQVRDALNEQLFPIRAEKIVCAVGPWTNYFLRLDDPSARKKIRTTKGIHIVYEDKISNHALLIPSDEDKRVFFIIPWMNHSLIGTTDTDYIKHPDAVTASDEDIDYLLSKSKRVFPGVNFKKEKIITTFAGLRPLIRQGGRKPSEVSRKHVTFTTKSQMMFVIGGKYTTD